METIAFVELNFASDTVQPVRLAASGSFSHVVELCVICSGFIWKNADHADMRPVALARRLASCCRSRFMVATGYASSSSKAAAAAGLSEAKTATSCFVCVVCGFSK